MQKVSLQVSALAAGTITSIAKEQPVFSLMDCSAYETIDRIHFSFIQFVHNNADSGASTWQEAWEKFMEFACSDKAVARMRELLKETGHSCQASGAIDTWLSKDNKKVMIDAETGAIARQDQQAEPFIIQEGFF